MTVKSISVVLMTLNEKNNIEILVPRLEKMLKKFETEIVIVDDSSSDGTIETAEKLGKKYGNIRIIVRKNERGFGSAFKRGYDEAKNDVIVSMDADLSFDEKEILKMIDLINKGYDLVVGSRHMGSGQYESQKFGIKLKKAVSTLGNKYISFISGVKVHDFSANFRAIKGDVWKAIETKELNNSILMEMIVKTKYKKFRIAEIPVSFKDRIYGESKLNLKKQALVFLFKATKLMAFRLRLN